MTTPFPFQSGAVLQAAELNAITTLPINDQTDDYTLVVGDVGKRVVMNVASANTVTVDDSIFAVGDTIFIANKGAGATTVTAGSGVTINSASGLALVQNQSGQLVALSASSFLFVASAGPAPTGGLTFIKAETIGTTVSSVTVTGAFSSTYENYFVTVSGGVASTTNFGRLTLGATATGYYKSTVYMNYNANTVNGISSSNATFWDDTVNGTTSNLNGAFYLFGPNVAKTTHFSSAASAATATGQVAWNLGYLNDTTQYTAFTITTNSGTFTGGTVRVYGLANS
jgi:hypothetical protein